MDIYKLGIKPLLFSGLKTDPELIHRNTLKCLHWLDSHPKNLLAISLLHSLEASCCIKDSRLEQTLWGHKFSNPLGLAAGFDKDGIAAGIWHKIGFGFAELGTVTFHPQSGNPPPRLFRLLEDEAVLNRMGFNNQGSEVLQQNLKQREKQFAIPMGINLGKSKITPLETAAEDYLGSFQRLQNLGNYFVINVSSPNTPGLRSLQNSQQLSSILEAIQQENQGQKPILVKIAPDLEWEAIASVLELAKMYQLAGIIATNTTIRKDCLKTSIITATGNPVMQEAGGISGKPLRDRATEVIRFIWQQTEGQLPIIGVGGIFTPEDAWEKITAGASLIQVYTGLVYEGPWMIERILKGLLGKLEEHGFENIGDAIGSGR
ncbi:quinone-dependent dihydroorotate dehydrogenase [Spirulina sp. 06S082]|uniref:quinone-dependent dihydroorotate dehydrogenase n=1 Tax=Spirulina sp. 06S082 TaxID=3110248 RepID=UPI002B21F071|nr:quinone-dependent dihydroorotate dehydrogenase [Spirulina sp. 06S082]MEA5468714.1 quinone-dependent dihydroorotate dehydrogenase [Spirulina sp. 06S082]